MAEAPKDIAALVEKFDRNLLDYRSSSYNEAQTRQEFINPFFKALGWDMDNEQGFSEVYKEVLYESSLKIGGRTKAPDYAFRIGEKIKFIVEAKKPSIDLEESTDPAYQLRYYAWNAHLPISILTDFDEFAIYDCRYPPKKTDKADTARLLYLKYTDYLTRWDEIAGRFSKTAILQGSFDKYVVESKGRKGTKEVDDAFLEAITSWREALARNIAIRNPDLSVEELNACVQATIDRIVFLRICEDRGIEEYGQLQEISSRENIYAGLCDIFKHADDRYNSGLFHFKEDERKRPDLLSLTLKIDDKVLTEIINSLYPPSPYNFALVPPEILGQVYEQFLGKVIRLTEGHRAKVEDKPEVKKAGGVFYTPTYIVDYIVENTVGKLLEGKTPTQVSELHVLDPACGSGSFLLGAYKKLLTWHLDWYIENLAPLLDAKKPQSSAEVRRLLPIQEEPKENNSRKVVSKKRERIKMERLAAVSMPIYKAGDVWRLTLYERKRILLQNIFGVDIDPQAVEVTKLSLLLKVLEGESREEVQTLLRFSNERALPDLDSNIKCGNSLIGWDILKDHPGLGQEEIERINPFDWEKEFPVVFQNGGFSVVMGNPPYGAHLDEITKDYFNNKFACQNYQLESYLLFLEQSIRNLLRKDGLYGMIIPNPWLTNLLQKDIRIFVTENTRILEIVHFKFPVFRGVTVDTEIVLLQKGDPTGWKPKATVAEMEESFKSLDYGLNLHRIEHTQEKWRRLNGGVINIFLDDKSGTIADKCQTQSCPLEMLYKINVGIKPYQKGKGTPPQTQATVDNRPFDSSMQIDDTYRLYLRGRDIGRYHISPIELRYLKYGPWLAEPRPAANFDAPIKIVMRQTGDSLVAALDRQQYLCLNNMHVLVPKTPLPNISYILGVLNSRLLNWFYQTRNPEVGEALAEVKKSNVATLPVHTIDFSDPVDKARHDRMVSLVNQMLSLHKQLKEARTPHEKTALQRQIEATDRQIDALVYELYGLTEEEIEIVEGS